MSGKVLISYSAPSGAQYTNVLYTYNNYIVSNSKGHFVLYYVASHYFITLLDLIHHNLQVRFPSMSKTKWHYIEYSACATMLL